MVRSDYPGLGETVLRGELENGMRLILVPKPGFSRVYAFLAVKYGGMDLRWDKNGEIFCAPEGTAHFLEHKMFETDEGSADLLLAANGAQSNAFTDSDMTAYLFECSDRFEENLRILLQFVAEPCFTQESVRKEVGIINQEILMCEDEPYWRVNRNLMNSLFKEHALRFSTIGTRESIAQITPEILKSCHEAFYVPSNMVLCVVGDVDPERFVSTARDNSPGRGPRAAAHLHGREAGPPVRPYIEEKMDIARPVFMFGCKTEPPPTGEDFLPRSMLCDLACDALLGGSSPLYARLYTRGLINGSFEGSSELFEGAGFVFARGESDEPEKVAEEILREAERIARDGIDEELFKRLKRSSFGSRLKELNAFEMTAWNLCDASFHSADYYRFPEWYERIDIGEASRFIADTFTEERSALSVIRPL
ncbi:MAG: insulinase family protein [Clostridiales bacterium]|jgi:predicted Zn-dependent peptidase|nr:insulinase family protein [Clostridiales bacterium]